MAFVFAFDQPLLCILRCQIFQFVFSFLTLDNSTSGKTFQNYKLCSDGENSILKVIMPCNKLFNNWVAVPALGNTWASFLHVDLATSVRWTKFRFISRVRIFFFGGGGEGGDIVEEISLAVAFSVNNVR